MTLPQRIEAAEGADDWRGAPDMHPWHMIAEELLARGWSIEDLAIRMVDPDHDKHVADAAKTVLVLEMYAAVGPERLTCQIGEQDGKAIARAFGISENMILNLERSWREAAALRAKEISDGE